jgi:hypothetical protein
VPAHVQLALGSLFGRFRRWGHVVHGGGSLGRGCRERKKNTVWCAWQVVFGGGECWHESMRVS